MTVIARAIRDKWASALSRIRVCYYRLMGTQIGDNCYISSGAHIDVASGKVIIGNKCGDSQRKLHPGTRAHSRTKRGK